MFICDKVMTVKLLPKVIDVYIILMLLHRYVTNPDNFDLYVVLHTQ